MWKYYALLSAFFAALTAIFAKIGVKRHQLRPCYSYPHHDYLVYYVGNRFLQPGNRRHQTSE